MSLQIEIYPPVNGNQYVLLSGRLDSDSHAQLDDALEPLLAKASPGMVLVLELARLDYISSAGIRSIFKARKALAGHGGKVLVVNPQAQIQKVFDVVKAVPMNEIFYSTAEADAYLDAMQRKILKGAVEDED